MLHVALALDRRGDVLIELEPHQPRQRVALGESLAETFAMLIARRAMSAVTPGVERAVRMVRHDVDLSCAAAHLGDGGQAAAAKT
jgi:hypothetical protein